PSCVSSFNTTPTTEIYTLSLHDALPISVSVLDLENKKVDASIKISSNTQRISISPDDRWVFTADQTKPQLAVIDTAKNQVAHWIDRKSTRLNSSHVEISYAVFCLKKKKI